MRALTFVLLVSLAGCVKSDRDEAIDRGATKLSKQEAEKLLTDHTLIGSIPHLGLEFALYYMPQGRLVGLASGPIDGRDRGGWRVADDGQVCLRWSQWEENEEKCRALWKDGDQLKVFEDDLGTMISSARREPGNAKKLETRTDLELVRTKESLTPLDAAALRALVPGNTLSGKAPVMKRAERHVFYAADNRAWTDMPANVIKDHGTYRIGGDGRLCATWSYLQGGHESCERWFKSDKGYFVFDAFEVLVMTGEVKPGDAQKLGK